MFDADVSISQITIKCQEPRITTSSNQTEGIRRQLKSTPKRKRRKRRQFAKQLLKWSTLIEKQPKQQKKPKPPQNKVPKGMLHRQCLTSLKVQPWTVGYGQSIMPPLQYQIGISKTRPGHVKCAREPTAAQNKVSYVACAPSEPVATPACRA